MTAVVSEGRPDAVEIAAARTAQHERELGWLNQRHLQSLLCERSGFDPLTVSVLHSMLAKRLGPSRYERARVERTNSDGDAIGPLLLLSRGDAHHLVELVVRVADAVDSYVDEVCERG